MQHIASALVITLIAGLIAVGCSGCSDGTSREAITKQTIDLLDETADTLSEVHDRESAEAVISKMEQLKEERNAIRSRLSVARKTPPSPEESRRIQERHGDRLRAAMQRVRQETNRLRRIPGVYPVLASQLTQITAGAGFMGGPSHFANQPPQSANGSGILRRFTIYVEGVPGDLDAELSQRILEIAKTKEAKNWQSSWSRRGDTFHITVSSPMDLQSVASQIDFGTVTETDGRLGVIRVKADLSRLPTPLAKPVTNPSDPNFYKQNLQDLGCFDKSRVEAAAKRLTEAEPRELRREIAAAAEKLIEQEHSAMVPAIDVLVRYSDGDVVPLLIELLKSDQPWVLPKAAKLLAGYQEPRAVDALAALITTDESLAAEVMRQVGAAGQHAVASYFQHEDPAVRYKAIEICAEIGDSEIVPAMILLFDDPKRRNRVKAISSVSRFKNAQAISPLCKILMSEQDRRYAVEALQEMGPMVEGTVLKGLKHSDPNVVYACCDVLRDVGTQQSLPPLQKLTQHSSFRIKAGTNMAIQGIEARMAGLSPR